MKVLNTLFGLALTIGLFSNTALAASCALTDVTAFEPGATEATKSNDCFAEAGNDQKSFIDKAAIEFGGSWELLFKSDENIELSITHDPVDDKSKGVWTVSDTDSSKITNPFIIVLKAGDAFAAYLFNIDTTGEGTFNTFTIHDKAKDISHISLYISTISPVPVPAAFWLMAPVFAGFMLRKRKA